MASGSKYCSLSPSYAELPLEIVLKVFEYLNFSDRQAAGATCKQWRAALCDTKIGKNCVAHFSKVTLADYSNPAKSVINSERPIQNIYFEDVYFSKVDEFFSHLSESLINFEMENCELTQRPFWRIMKNFKKLKSITVSNCSSLFMFSSNVVETFDECTDVLKDVTHLSLPRNQYLTDSFLNKFTLPIKKLESLDISLCNIAYHFGLQRRFYPQHIPFKPSDSILTFSFILDLLRRHKDNISELNLSGTNLSLKALLAFNNIDGTQLRLKKLWLSGCRQINIHISGFLYTQTSLTHLDLSNTLCVTDEVLETIVNCIRNLRVLDIGAAVRVTDEGIILLKKLKKLCALSLNRCTGISSEGIIHGIARKPNLALQDLDLSGTLVHYDAVIAVALNLKELRCLRLDGCVHGASDESVQMICQNLVKLRELSLEGCLCITDTALTGFNIAKLEEKFRLEYNKSANSLAGSSEAEKFLDPIEFSMTVAPVRVSLRSKAEEEIVRDANRKRALMRAHELIGYDFDKDGVGIENLKCLQILNLNNCNKITDVSLKYGMKFSELKSLSVSRCQQISFIGMEALASNTPALEELNISDCHNINDRAMQIITEKLKRLRVLHISGCSQLTDHSLDAINVNCKYLHTLFAHRCRQMYGDIEDRLLQLSTLRNVYRDNVLIDDVRLKKTNEY